MSKVDWKGFNGITVFTSEAGLESKLLDELYRRRIAWIRPTLTETHPVTVVKACIRILKNYQNNPCPVNIVAFTPEAVMALKYIAEALDIPIRFVMLTNNGLVDYGTDIEPIFESFNKAMEIISQYMPDSESECPDISGETPNN